MDKNGISKLCTFRKDVFKYFQFETLVFSRIVLLKDSVKNCAKFKHEKFQFTSYILFSPKCESKMVLISKFNRTQWRIFELVPLWLNMHKRCVHRPVTFVLHFIPSGFSQSILYDSSMRSIFLPLWGIFTRYFGIILPFGCLWAEQQATILRNYAKELIRTLERW